MANKTFAQFGLKEEILQAIELLHYKQPTPVQTMLIEAMLAGKDVAVQAQTGSGKTAAFAIPICDMLDWNENRPQALILAPTRELALQIKEDVFNVGRFKRIKVSAIFGKSPYKAQVKELKQKTHVVVGTPGRVMDHLEQGTLDLSALRWLVIDEADEMLNLGFMEQMDQILQSVPKKRQTVLLSATIPAQIQDLLAKYSPKAHRIVIEDTDKVADRIEQFKMETTAANKLKLLKDLLIVENPDSCIVFANQKATVDLIRKELSDLGIRAHKLHGGLEQEDRIAVINDFKRGAFRYLVATDVAARGLDIEAVSLIVNYDIPLETELYVHRIGRTGRFDQKGKAITFVTSNQHKHLHAVEAFIGRTLSAYEHPSPELLNAAKPKFARTIGSLPKSKGHKSADLNEGIQRLLIKCGKLAKIRPVDIVGAICGLPNLEAADIGIIHIGDITTTVDILNAKGQQVFEMLQNIPIKGKLRKVTKVEEK
jgi:ATP-dependent RNA helicase DeaD